MKKSPFSTRSMITKPDLFHGRKVVISEIFNALCGEKSQSIVVVGEKKRIGLSSLLYHIKLNKSDMFSDQPYPYRFGYVNLASDTINTPNDFYGEAAQSLLDIPFDSLKPGHFEDLLRKEGGHITRNILLLDNFNNLQLSSKKGQFTDTFYDGLRARAQQSSPCISYVIASAMPLSELALKHNFKSRFFGIFHHTNLDVFTEDEARNFILRSNESKLRESDFQHIQKWVNHEYHPLKLSIAADLIWVNQPDVNYRNIRKQYYKSVDLALGKVTNKPQNIQRKTRLYGKMLADVFNYIRGDTSPLMFFFYIFVCLCTLYGLYAGLFSITDIYNDFFDFSNTP